jgi:rubrerythrin
MSRMTWKKAIEIAINREIEAASSYRQLAAKAMEESVRELFLDLAQEEDKHKEKLEKLDWSNLAEEDLDRPVDLGLTDGLIVESLSPEIPLQDLLVRAAQKEKQAATFYASLAQTTKSMRLKRLFRYLEKQEKSHKLRLELEYERVFLPED